MSLSINDLLQSIGGNTKQIKPSEGQLHNPDIPDSEPITEFDDELELNDQYSTVMRIGGAYNGTNLPLKEQGQLDVMNPRRVDFSLTNAIDPNVIRSKIDPDSAQPSYNRYSKFSLMPDSVKPPKSQIGLIKESRGSYINYQNRLNPGSAKATSTANSMKKPLEYGEPHDIIKEPWDDLPPAYDFDNSSTKKKEPTEPIHKDPDGETTQTGTGIVDDHDQDMVDDIGPPLQSPPFEDTHLKSGERFKPGFKSGSKPVIHTIYNRSNESGLYNNIHPVGPRGLY